jgi:hypothetical protein
MKRFIHFFALYSAAPSPFLSVPRSPKDGGSGEFASLTGGEATFGINSSNGVALNEREYQ